MFFETVCTLLSLSAVWCSGSLSRATWVLMLVASLCNAFLYFEVERYGHMFLDIIYGILAIFGFSAWSDNQLKTKYLDKKQYIFLFFMSLIGSILLYVFLEKMRSQDIFWDVLSFVTGIVGIVLMIGKYVDQWYIWVLHDLFNLFLSLRASLWLIALKQICYLFFAARGYWLWRLNALKLNLAATV